MSDKGKGKRKKLSGHEFRVIRNEKKRTDVAKKLKVNKLTSIFKKTGEHSRQTEIRSGLEDGGETP